MKSIINIVLNRELSANLNLIQNKIPAELYSNFISINQIEAKSSLDIDYLILEAILNKYSPDFSEFLINNFKQEKDSINYSKIVFDHNTLVGVTSSLILIKSNELKIKLLEFIKNTKEGYRSILELYYNLNSYLELLISDLYNDYPKRLIHEKIEKLTFFNILNPIYDLDDKFVPYLFFHELGLLLINYIEFEFEQFPQILIDIIDFFAENKNFEFQNQILTELNQRLLELMVNLLIRNGLRVSNIKFQNGFESLINYISEFLNAQVWLYTYNYDILLKRIINQDSIENEALMRLGNEFFTSPSEMFHSKYFTFHTEYLWTDFIKESDETEGQIQFLTRVLFELIDQGFLDDTTVVETLIDLLEFDYLDNYNFRLRLVNYLFHTRIHLSVEIQMKLNEIYKEEALKLDNLEEKAFLDHLLSPDNSKMHPFLEFIEEFTILIKKIQLEP